MLPRRHEISQYERHLNVGSAVNDLSRELGGALGIAVLGSVLNAGYRDDLDLDGLRAPAAEAARSSLAAANHVGSATGNPSLIEEAGNAFASGMHLALISGAGAAVLAAAVVTFLLRRAGKTGTVAEGTPDSDTGYRLVKSVR
ncbi:hypothetical protein [Streptomyces hokutonensis]|uniref:hypothetical protein n=1 Tax=Streptomyces hokutonensis TaxID=1306990 RepID=UPI00037860DC|nr:hypothetical protein [Streptomyces hokutonensis]